MSPVGEEEKSVELSFKQRNTIRLKTQITSEFCEQRMNMKRTYLIDEESTTLVELINHQSNVNHEKV